jgi:ATP-dependent Clp protease protease subunit
MTTPTTTPPDATTLADPVFERLLGERVVVLGQEIDDPLANRIVSQLLLLAAEDPVADITLYINSPGGSVTAGMAIFDTMLTIEPDVSTVAIGLAASMGQFLLTAGAPGKRLALPRARIMMHQPSGGAGGSASDILIRAEMLTRLKREIAEITAARTGQPVSRIVADFDRDRWFSAQQAVDYGLVDGVLPARSRPAQA